MVYVDLNPIRAKLSDNLEDSNYTSIQQRITDYSEQQSLKSDELNNQSKSIKLADFTHGSNIKDGIPYSLKDYFELTDWTVRVVREDKRGSISEREPKILAKLGINTEKWLDTVTEYSKSHHAFVGNEKQLKQVCELSGKKWLSGIKMSRLLYC